MPMRLNPSAPLLAAAILLLAGVGCGGHTPGHPQREPVTLEEALDFAMIDYTEGTISFGRYVDVLDSLGRKNPGIGKSLLHDDPAFEKLVQDHVERGKVPVDQYRRYLQLKLGYLQEYARTLGEPDTLRR